MKVHIMCHRLAKGDWMGIRIGKGVGKKLKSSRKVIFMARGLTGRDYMRVYSHF